LHAFQSGHAHEQENTVQNAHGYVGEYLGEKHTQANENGHDKGRDALLSKQKRTPLSK